ncbi:MAG: iron chelate uptake ABC transporter family permease subunit [Oceanidesulfovibrio sp.]
MILDAVIAPLGEMYFQKALLGGILVAVVSGVVGSLVVLRRMAFLGDALAHAMIAGVAGGYLGMKLLFGLDAHAPGMLLGSLIAAVLTVFLIGFVSRVSRVKEDASIGIMYTGVFAAGVVLVSVFRQHIHIDLMHFIMGDVLAVGDADLFVAAFTCGLVLTVILLFYRSFQILSFDPVMAAAIGVPVVLLDYVLTTCVSLVVVSAVSMVGVILVVGLLITPAATAYLLADRLERMMALAAVFGVSSVVGGLYLSLMLDASGGGAVMLFCTLQFLVVLAVAPRYGLLARWRRQHGVPPQLIEDILALAARREGRMEVADIRANVDRPRLVNRALKTMQRQKMAGLDNGTMVLTSPGMARATEVLRAHRLWETYLEHVGTPADELHPRAHELEHMHDPSTMADLDDLLEHPEIDPHGEPIPADPVVTAGALVPASLLREGFGGRVESVAAPATTTGVSTGELVYMGARLATEEGHARWNLRTVDGASHVLDHAQADAIIVRVEEQGNERRDVGATEKQRLR